MPDTRTILSVPAGECVRLDETAAAERGRGLHEPASPHQIRSHCRGHGLWLGKAQICADLGLRR